MDKLQKREKSFPTSNLPPYPHPHLCDSTAPTGQAAKCYRVTMSLQNPSFEVLMTTAMVVGDGALEI